MVDEVRHLRVDVAIVEVDKHRGQLCDVACLSAAGRQNGARHDVEFAGVARGRSQVGTSIQFVRRTTVLTAVHVITTGALIALLTGVAMTCVVGPNQ